MHKIKYVLLGATLCVMVARLLPAQTSSDPFKVRAERHQAPSRFFPSPSGPPQFGEPLRGLTTNQLSAFGVGLDDFQEEDTIASGLGPVFNNVSCVACHSAPAVGGSSPTNEVRFGR